MPSCVDMFVSFPHQPTLPRIRVNVTRFNVIRPDRYRLGKKVAPKITPNPAHGHAASRLVSRCAVCQTDEVEPSEQSDSPLLGDEHPPRRTQPTQRRMRADCAPTARGLRHESSDRQINILRTSIYQNLRLYNILSEEVLETISIIQKKQLKEIK